MVTFILRIAESEMSLQTSLSGGVQKILESPGEIGGRILSSLSGGLHS